ncbi:hypothetical protein [Chryseobacterium koreense]|uniref:DUF4136 domain-containing protein n=1 Tax=Chryseobacterium koreense CCUG 49689 TaxID=1304281 RepID=A0A0J7J2S0_9FLAO|nr:hypothetical protein [Chryseobacterium koreense]KMQ72354.1 hypothetical protein ACM44_02650 [Chryseobacterium koreense CCUG 49689]MBB5334777.1 hypothetical protein [Chryseobacterium koreense]
MLKKILLLAFFGSLTFINAQEKDLLNVPNPIDFNGTEFYLIRAEQRSKTLFQQQYLPKDEELEKFNQIFEYTFLNKEIDIENAVRQKVEMVQEKQKEDKYAKVNVSESPDGSEYIVDYYISESPANGDSFVEYDIFRFKKFDNGTQKSFLMVNYGKRIYGDPKSAVKILAKQRDPLMTAMIEYKIPEIKVQTATTGSK